MRLAELVGPGDVRAQTEQCLVNIRAALDQLGGSLADVVQVTVMKVVNMAVMADRCMPAIRAMLVGMVWMLLFSTSGHASLSLFVCNPIGD